MHTALASYIYLLDHRIYNPNLVMVIRTAKRTTCHDWAFKGCIVQPGFQFSPALREWESVGIRLRPLGNAAHVACLLLLCQGFEWLTGKSVWLAFRRSWVRIPATSWIFFCGFYFSLSQQKHHHSWVPTVTYSNKHQASELKIMVEVTQVFMQCMTSVWC